MWHWEPKARVVPAIRGTKFTSADRVSAGEMTMNIFADLDELIARDQDAADYCSDAGQNEAMRRLGELQGIRAAVADLIAAINEHRAALAEWANAGNSAAYDRWMASEERLTAALARCGGAP
jgi:hypothetical protein